MANEARPQRPLMESRLLKAAIEGNFSDLAQHFNDIGDGQPNHITGMEDTFLHIFSAHGHINLVTEICTKDSSLLEARNVRNETPFHHAARFGHISTILELIRCAGTAYREERLKEMLRQRNCLGETALHEAARYGHAAVVSILMEKDLELAGLVNNDSVSPLYLAVARGSLNVVLNMVAIMLRKKITRDFHSGPKRQTALHAAVFQGPGM